MASAYTQQSRNYRKTMMLIFLFIGLTSAVFYVISLYYNNLAIAFVGLFISIFQAFAAYYWGGTLAIKSAGGVEVSEKDAPQLHVLVENLCKIAGIPKPKIFISPDPSANAFACGRNPEHANICLNQGLLDILSKSELEGVIAHELSHVKNRDILVMTVTMVLASVIGFVADIGFRLQFFGGRRNSDDEKNPIVMILYILVIVLAPFVALLIQMSISRSREYLADATAVTYTRYPDGLIDALTKITKNPVPTKKVSSAMNHFYIDEPKTKFGQRTKKMFSTHPPMEDRIAKLKEMGSNYQ